jgi:hypothetical protein
MISVRTDAPIGGDVEDDGVGRDFLIDGLKEHLELIVSCPLGEAVAGRNARHRPILDRKTEHLCEAGFTGTKETRHPEESVRHVMVSADALAWIRKLKHGFQSMFYALFKLAHANILSA